MPAPWYLVENVAQIDTPALLVYPDRVRENIRLAIEIAGGVERLRPHVKTHKMAEVIDLHLAAGVDKFKCATLAEAEMAAQRGAADVLLAYQPVGPAAVRFARLVETFGDTAFSTIVDDRDAMQALSAALAARGQRCRVLLDLDLGMGRTGVLPGDQAFALYQAFERLPALQPGGLHAYDGHIHDTDVGLRTRRAEAAYAPVAALRQRLEAAGLPVPLVVAGGSPTFPIHAPNPDRETSPGTYVFWDSGYGPTLSDLPFLPAALVLTRVISKPAGGRLCLDLGHKALSADKPSPRVQLLNLLEAEEVVHSEEHLTVATPAAQEFQVGDVLYGVPRHICPTVALHDEAVIIHEGRAGERWKVVARRRKISV